MVERPSGRCCATRCSGWLHVAHCGCGEVGEEEAQSLPWGWGGVGGSRWGCLMVCSGGARGPSRGCLMSGGAERGPHRCRAPGSGPSSRQERSGRNRLGIT